MREHVAKALCKAAGESLLSYCPICHDETGKRTGPCNLWETFLSEADAAIQAVRDQAQVFMRPVKKRKV